MKKEEQLALQKERLLLLEMTPIIARHGYKVKKTYDDKHGPLSVRSICQRLARIRAELKVAQSPKTFAERAKSLNEQLFKKYVGDRRFYYDVTCGNRCGAKWEKTKFSKGDASFRIGYMWRRSVWKNFIKDSQMVTDNIILLRAEEFKINVDHIRLFEAKVFDLKEKKEVNGYIGKSKLGGKAMFKKERNLAIAGAIARARKDVSGKILGETE